MNRSEIHVYGDGRVKLSGTAYARMKIELAGLAENKCEECGRYTPYSSGDPDHQVLRGMGGARRDDRIFVDGRRQLIWKCRQCHEGRHKPAKVLPAKERLSDDEFRRLIGL